MLWLDLAACVFPNICIYSFMRGYNTSARLWEQLRSSTICHSFVFIRDIWARASLPPMCCLVQVVMGAGIFLFLCWADLNFFVCVRDGGICGCIVTTTFVHKLRNLWQTRLYTSQPRPYLPPSQQYIHYCSFITGEQLDDAVELFDTIWYKFGAKELWQYKVTPHWKVTWKVLCFGFQMKIKFSNNFHVDVQSQPHNKIFVNWLVQLMCVFIFQVCVSKLY